MRRSQSDLVFVLHSGSPGGGSRFLRTLCLFARQEGYRVSVICDGSGEFFDHLRQDGIPVVNMPLATVARSARSLPRLVRTLRELQPQLLHVHGQPAGFFGALAGRLARVPRLLYAAVFPAFHSDFDPYRRLRNRIAEQVPCRLANRVVCVSQHDRDEYVRRGLVRTEKLTCIPSCVETRFFAVAPEEAVAARHTRLAEDTPVVGFVGRLTDQKGVETLLQAVPQIRALYPTARIVIGGDGPLQPALEALARQIGIVDAVHFLGYVADPIPVFQMSNIVTVPSRFEPLGIVAAEAQALGKPVVASRTGGLPEIVEDGVTGILVPPGDSQMLASAVCRLLQKPALARSMGARGRENSRVRFSEEQVLSRYRILYRDLLDQGAMSPWR